MLGNNFSKTPKDWHDYIVAKSTDRCDLGILLKDEWRHKISVRDDIYNMYDTHSCSIFIQDQSYMDVQKALSNHKVSFIFPYAITAWHLTLGSYGHGSQTAIAILDLNGCDGYYTKILPTFFDHVQHANRSCHVVVQEITNLLYQQNVFMHPDSWPQSGLFDAAIANIDFDYKVLNQSKHVFPLMLLLFDNPSHHYLECNIVYALKLFDEKVIVGLLEVLQELLLQLVFDPNKLIKSLDLISEKQAKELMNWNTTDGMFPDNLSLHDLVERAVQKTPNAEALVYDDRSVSYSEMDAYSNQVANWLLKTEVGIQANPLIALYLDKNIDVVLTILGVWKAGFAFVPIDIHYPEARVRFILEDSGAKYIITNSTYSKQLYEIVGDIQPAILMIEIDQVLQSAQQETKLENQFPKLNVDRCNLAYITYTSGTTGVPKGVPKFHRSVVNSITDLSERYDMLLPGTEQVALFSSYVFEPFIRQMLIALINAQTLVIVPDHVRSDPYLFAILLKKHRITYLNGTGSVLQHYDLSHLPFLKRLLLVGEELTTSLLKQLRKNFHKEIINEYSFTEAAFVTTIKKFAPNESERVDRSIGLPVRNVKCYVLSQHLKQVPIGAIGELYIGGMGIAPGYLNREELTKKCFLSNPFQTTEEKLLGNNQHIYKTGDLARFLPNGELEYMGRSDFQLKINGVRIEPGEIEANVMAYHGIKKCVVMPYQRDDGSNYLVGYFVAEKDLVIQESDLISHLEKRLMRVMVPSRMVQLEDIPLNVNGKVDRNLLLDRNPLTKINPPAYLVDTLKSIWSKLLKIQIDKIGTEDDFFRLGGQSITSILLVANVRNILNLKLDVESIFTLRTITRIASYLAQQDQIVATQQPPLIVGSIEQPITLPANGLHQGLLYQALKKNTADDAYIMQSVYRYHSQIDIHFLKKAWEYALRKYPGLQLSFEWESVPLQIMHSNAKLNWNFEDLSHLANIQEQEEHILAVRVADRKQGYNLSVAPLFRIYLIKQQADLFTLIFSCHHIILDGWSLSILHDEVHRTYLSLMECKTLELKEDLAYVATQQYWQLHVNDSNTYWEQQIACVQDRSDLTGLLNQEHRYKINLANYDQILEHKEKRLSLGIKQTAMLKSVCVDHLLTLHSILQFVWHKVLHTIGDGQHTVVGTIVSGRNLPIQGIERSIGLFINTLPLIVDHKQQKEHIVSTAITDIQAKVRNLDMYSIVSLGNLKIGTTKRGLFDTLLVLENYPAMLDIEEATYHKKNLCFEHAFDIDKVDYPLAVVAREENNELVIKLWYAGELFDELAIDTLLDTTAILFEQLSVGLSMRVDQLSVCSHKTVASFDLWNHTAVPFDQSITLHRIFEQVVKKWPDSTAVVFDKYQLSYLELDNQANQIAHQLIDMVKLQPNDLVVLVLDKSEKMIAAILAVWKAGAAYVPLDPKFPDERIAFILKDTQTRVIVTNTSHKSRINLVAEDNQCIIDIDQLSINDQLCIPPTTSVTSTDLAYAIYTSGTTGQPKAVLVEHRGVVNLHAYLAQLFSLHKEQGDEAILSFSNYVFDHFVEQMIDALLNGQKLVVLHDAMREDQEWLLSYMNQHKVTYLSGTPSVLSIYDFSKAQYLKRIDAIGEDFTTPTFNKIRDTFKGVIINGYGPTEVSITTHKRVYTSDEWRLNKSIGYPVANTTCYILNQSMQRVPIGSIGELYIGGIGVARGYLNQPKLTAERFLKNPFQTTDEAAIGMNARIYKTGDLVRWLPNGELEYLGRNDFQIKIRGQRVELGEIEAALTSYPGITRSFIIVRDYPSNNHLLEPQKYLVGFYIADHTIDEEILKKWMRLKIADAIIPTRIVRIDHIPVTINGKLDIKKLPEIDFTSATGYTQPTSHIECSLSQIWSKVLGISVDSIGIYDDFFSLGGDSIRAISLAQTIKNTFKKPFSVASVFDNITIFDQANYIQGHIDATEPKAITKIYSDQSKQTIPLSFAQQRLMFIDAFEGGSIAYNIPFCLEMDLTHHTTKENLIASVKALLCRHPALRTLLKQGKDGEYTQHVIDQTTALDLFQITENTVNSYTELDAILITREQHLFQLNKGLPIQVGLFVCLDAPYKIYLQIVVHHSCFDGWSWDIFQKELMLLITGRPVSDLQNLPVTYADFTLWQRNNLTQEYLLELSEYWKSFLEGVESAQLPQDFLRPARFDYRGREIEFYIDKDVVKSLKQCAKSNRVSLYTVFLSCFSLVIKIFNRQHDFIIGTPYANRDQPECNGVIGFFASLLPFRITVDRLATLQAYIQSVGQSITQAQAHNAMPFEEIIRALKVENDPSRSPIIQIIFTLQDNTPLDERLSMNQHLSMRLYKPKNNGHTTTKFDATITLSKITDGGFIGNFTYAVSLFKAESVQLWIDTFLHILNEFTRLLPCQDSATLNDISWVPLDQKVLPSTIEHTKQIFSAIPLAHHIFEKIAVQQPHVIAVMYENIKLSYAELDRLSNQMAHYLLASVCLSPGDLVGLVLDKSEKMIISILAVWKAGAAYLPLDPNYPDARISFMLEDAQVRLVLTHKMYHAKIYALVDASLSILDLEAAYLDNYPSTPPITFAKNTDLAYAIYTSGTTGKPKAVLIEHKNLVSFLYSIPYFQTKVPEQECILFLSNYVFDFSIEQIALSLLSGNALLVTADGLSFHDDTFYETMNDASLTYLSGTPTQVHQIDLSRIKSLRTVVVAGELFQVHHFNKIIATFNGNLYNAYGTTESTVYNIVHSIDKNAPYCNTLGDPILNTSIYILDETLKHLPDGAIGELYLAGPCVARGYLKQPHLTNKRFLPNPYAHQGKEWNTLYQTGDLVRKKLDGALAYIGRNDTQVKINGIRIELGEIEATLREYPTIESCAVIPQIGHKKILETPRLIGYVVVKEGHTLEVDKILAFLRKRLMPNMIPSELIPILGALPMTVNGKLDIHALPALSSTMQDTYVAPRNRMDAMLCAIWRRYLHKDNIGIRDNFFKIGGDSIKAMILASNIQNEFKTKIRIKDLFDHPSVAEFVDHVLNKAIDNPLDAHEVHLPYATKIAIGICPMLPIQKWFFTLPLIQPACWNQHFAIRTAPLDTNQLYAALVKLVAYHDVFRLRYRINRPQGGVEQYYDTTLEKFGLYILDVSHLDNKAIQEQLHKWQSNFDLEKGPIFCIAYLSGFHDGSARIWFAMHHLIVDTVSWQILARDLEILYYGGDLGAPVCQYIEWVHAIDMYLPIEQEVQIWDNLQNAIHTDTSLDHIMIDKSTDERWIERFEFSIDTTKEILVDVHEAYDTHINDILLTAVGLALCAITGRKTSYLTLESHGRPGLKDGPEVRDSVGWFTAMYPIAIEAYDDLEQTILSVQTALSRIPNQGIGYGKLKGTYGNKSAPLPRISFNYLGQLSSNQQQKVEDIPKFWSLDTSMCGIYKGENSSVDSPFVLDFTIYVSEGHMVVEIDSRLTRSLTTQLKDQLKTKLEQLIDHTKSISKVRERSPYSHQLQEIFEPYILINQEKKDHTLFIFPPGEGGAESYLNNISKQLHDVRLLLFNNIHLIQPMESFELLATYYIDYIKQIQRIGPYHFLGWSFGGVLALEITLQLAKSDILVKNLMLIDSYFDVRYASECIGLADTDNILDPINYYYTPKKENLDKLLIHAPDVLLFKSGKVNDVFRNQNQKHLFEYYNESPFNNLDRILPKQSIVVEILANDTHHSWVHNKEQVLCISDRIIKAMAL